MRTAKQHQLDPRIPRITEEPATSIITVPMTDADRALIEDMARVAGQSIVNVVRLALWQYARHLDIDAPIQVFGVRRFRDRDAHPSA